MSTPRQSIHPTPAREPSAMRPAVPDRGVGLRLLGWVLLFASVGLVSCESLFYL